MGKEIFNLVASELEKYKSVVTDLSSVIRADFSVQIGGEIAQGVLRFFLPTTYKSLGLLLSRDERFHDPIFWRGTTVDIWPKVHVEEKFKGIRACIDVGVFIDKIVLVGGVIEQEKRESSKSTAISRVEQPYLRDTGCIQEFTFEEIAKVYQSIGPIIEKQIEGAIEAFYKMTAQGHA